MSNANDDKLETIRAKKAKFLSQVQANSTHSTLDAVDHEQDLETQRQKRKDSTVEVVNPTYAKRKAGIDDGNKTEQDLSEEYPMEEMEDMKTQESGEPAEGVPEEVNKSA